MTRASVLAQGARFRQRKLSTKQQLQILREDQVEKIDDEAQRNIPKVDTGVEKAEELEHHLQAALSASHAAAGGGKVAQSYIPTPDAVPSSIQYDALYPKRFSQPATFIRFSSTVEECIGSPYCMDEEDAVALKILNQKRGASTQCSEEDFEEVMSFFEEVANRQHKYAYVDGTPILSFEDFMKDESFKEMISEPARQFAEALYEHWSSRRTESGNRNVQPALKFETGRESDDGDPYVCFRRREVRLARKTRARDNQSVQKLQKLKQELIDAMGLASLHKQNVLMQKEQMIMNRQLFEQRTALKDIKRKLGIKGDDEDLINQKPKKKMVDAVQLGQRMPAQHIRFPQRPGHPADDLQMLDDLNGDKENEIKRDIQTKVAQHSQWNRGYHDQTRHPLTPTLPKGFPPEFRLAAVAYLPTPPASASSEQSNDALLDVASSSNREREPVRYSSPCEEAGKPPSFRRRLGRNNRLWIDRRMPSEKADITGIDPDVLDRFKYDHDDDDDEELEVEVDSFDPFHMRYRAHLFDRSREAAAAQAQAARRVQSEAGGPSNALVPTTHS